MYRRGYYARDLNSGAPIRFVQFVPRFFPRCPLYSFIISMPVTPIPFSQPKNRPIPAPILPLHDPLLLYDLNTSKNPVFPYENYDVFELENVDEAECKAEFRVEKAELPQLAEVLGIPCVFRCDQRTVCDGMEGLCMLLRRLAYPCRYSDLIPRFGRPVPEISMTREMRSIMGRARAGYDGINSA